ncbi:bile acid:sodium symporter family protein [Catenovulum sediminis]|uniref:bile acid:sodium symporter family protein n=1 Tax=Catenovulum sediminis TaxID=1740262 RepID=UPI001180FDBB|nr:bile acid:sodium symporter family protein [Catenovulum sediminis]
MQATILSQVILPASLFIIMLGMGLSLKLTDFSRVLLQPKAAIIGIACQMLLLPLVGFIFVWLFSLQAELAVGLMLLTFCPGGVTSNMYSYLANGDTALSISLTAVVSLFAPFTIPLLTVWMMELFMNESQHFSLPIGKTMIQLSAITLLPVAIGMWLHRQFPVFAHKADKPVKALSLIFLFLIIAGIVANEWENMAGYFVATGLATLSLNVTTLMLGFYLAKQFGLNKRQSTSIGIEVGIQNGTLALLVANSILQNPVMTTPAITYSLLMFVTGAVFAYWVKIDNETV